MEKELRFVSLSCLSLDGKLLSPFPVIELLPCAGKVKSIMGWRGFIPPFRPIEARNTCVLLLCIIYPQHPSRALFVSALCTVVWLAVATALLACSLLQDWSIVVVVFLRVVLFSAAGTSSQTSTAPLYCQTPFALFLQALHGHKPTCTSTAKCLVYYFKFFMTG